MSLTTVQWQMINTPSASAASIADKTASINATGKYAGLMAWDTTNNRMMRASGSSSTSTWYCVDGSVSVTPA